MIVLCIVFVLCPSFIVNAEYTIPNDGKALSEPYGDCKLPKSFEAEYYDCYIPYNLTPIDIGGWATGARWAAYSQYNSPMPEYLRNTKISGYMNYENDISNLSRTLQSTFSHMQKGYEDDTGMFIVTDSNGTQYYVAAFPEFLFNCSSAGQNGFSGYSSSAWGTAIDLILTDGTVLHFMMGDSQAQQHGNGGISNPQYFDVIYDNAPMVLGQYIHLFQAQSGHCVELWGRNANCASKFMEKYNIGNGDDNNRVAVARVYNVKGTDSPKRVSGIDGKVSYSINGVSIGASSNSSVGVDSSGNTIVSEWDLVGMPKQSGLTSDKQIYLPDGSELSIGEGYSISKIGNNIKSSKGDVTLNLVRVLVVFIGMCLVMYSVLVLMCMVFDRANSFIEVSLVSVVSFGHLTYTDEDFGTSKGYVGTKKLVVTVCLVCLFGLLLISGGVLPFLMNIVYSVKDIFK